jgi:hypothetical protein
MIGIIGQEELKGIAMIGVKVLGSGCNNYEMVELNTLSALE